MMPTRLRASQHRVSRRAVGMWTLSRAISELVCTAVLSVAVWGVGTTDWTWVPGWLRDHPWWPVAG